MSLSTLNWLLHHAGMSVASTVLVIFKQKMHDIPCSVFGDIRHFPLLMRASHTQTHFPWLMRSSEFRVIQTVVAVLMSAVLMSAVLMSAVSISCHSDCGPDGRPNGQWTKLPYPGKPRKTYASFMLCCSCPVNVCVCV